MIIISGPSTVGKNPFIYQACELYNLEYVTPYTTRSARKEEINGEDYYFLSKLEFQSKLRNREMTEWDYCLGNYYGYTFKFPGNSNQITHGLSRMALRIKAKYPEQITTIFLMPSSLDKIYENLHHIYTDKMLMLREALVEEEICHSVLFDKIIYVSETVTSLFDNKKMKQMLLDEINC